MQFKQNIIEMTPYLIIDGMACHGIAWHGLVSGGNYSATIFEIKTATFHSL